MKGAAQRGLTVLADPTRARILRLIRDADGGHALVGKLADALDLRQPTVSHHMKALLSEGVVVRERDGRRVWYSIAPDQIDRVNALIGADDAASSEPDLDRIVDDLSLRFRGTFSSETVRASVQNSYDLLATGSTSPLLASRTASFAATRLEALSRAQGDLPARPEVLFVCVQNSGRSQLAAGILRHLAGDRVGVRSAGSAPGPELRTSVVQALDEIGVSVGGEFPKPLTDDVVRAADVVVTMGCGDSCPVFPGRRYLDWPLEDPMGKPMVTVRSIRDDIEGRVRALLDEILAY
ncbi:ArsR family transcriptional regulator [Microbacterium trichothecenolyticum]|uniref:metalloregulator ArsR/SmtB family transcription factor n=1 Tax=Microbacterium trichothecenolyticum TaxID=69370 RepID=UPI0028622695|nr:metalloregulator ArsR/SmtB family transcription factor [Microbacterium trichothecenolyticum]MDR7183049.1 ArsR family transcriptional regulator [Microbacterium trichothecenolyticum]